MSATEPPGGPGADPGQPTPPPTGRRVRALFVLAVVLAFVAGAAVFAVIDDDPTYDDTASTTSPTTSPDTTTSTTPETTAATTTERPSTTSTTSTTGSPADTSSAVWPPASGPRYDTPVAAARGFAVDFVGFRSPVVGAFRQGDPRSGEVDVRARANGPATTVLVRQLGSGGRWFVLGSTTPNLNLTEPAALAEVTSPLRLRGTSTAFEATVNVEVRQDGTRQPIGSGTFMGGANGEMGPFDSTVTFRTPTADAGAVLLLTFSAEDGRVWEASTVRVRF